MTFTQFSWNGEAIADVRVWARERGEQMVRARHTWREPMPLAGQILEREEIIDMPACFFDCMRFGGPRDDQYAEVERFDP